MDKVLPTHGTCHTFMAAVVPYIELGTWRTTTQRLRVSESDSESQLKPEDAEHVDTGPTVSYEIRWSVYML